MRLGLADIIYITKKLISHLEDSSNHYKPIGEVFSKNDLVHLFKQFPIKESKHMYSEPQFREFAVHALHVLRESHKFDEDVLDGF